MFKTESYSFAISMMATLFLLMFAWLFANQTSIAQTAFDCSAVTEISTVECEALVALYNSTDGDNWHYETGWLAGDPCLWDGVSCQDGVVISVRIEGFGASGAIPPEIGNLSNLIYLTLTSNELTSLPAEIGNLSNLRYLRVQGNQLIELPAEIGNLPNLLELNMYDNALTQIPAEIGNLSNLESLILSLNPLTTLPAELSNLNALEELSINSIPLVAWPDSFVDLNLSVMQMSNVCEPTQPALQAWLDGINVSGATPGRGSALCTESSSVPTDFTCANVTEIPTIECSALVAFYHSTGGGNWTDETGIWLQTDTPCSWNGIVCENGSVTRLDRLGKGLSGGVPSEISDLTHLTSLDVKFNGVTFISDEIGNLSNLTQLAIGSNSITTIPREVADLSNLTVLDVSSNFLTSLPYEIGNLSNLERLYIYSNPQLTSIPPEIGNLSNLDTLSLFDTPITSWPDSFTALNNVTLVQMENVCEPAQPELQAWLDGIDRVDGRGSTPCISTAPPPGALQTLDEEYRLALGAKLVPYQSHLYYGVQNPPEYTPDQIREVWRTNVDSGDVEKLALPAHSSNSVAVCNDQLYISTSDGITSYEDESGRHWTVANAAFWTLDADGELIQIANASLLFMGEFQGDCYFTQSTSPGVWGGEIQVWKVQNQSATKIYSWPVNARRSNHELVPISDSEFIFSSNEEINGYGVPQGAAIFRSDGMTVTHTAMRGFTIEGVTDNRIYTSYPYVYIGGPNNVIPPNFRAYDLEGNEQAGYEMFAIEPGYNLYDRPHTIGVLGDQYIFVGDTASGEPSIWSTTGDIADVEMLHEDPIFPCGSVELNGKLYFCGVHADYSLNLLWVTDGVTVERAISQNLHVSDLHLINGMIYFVGDDGATGRELYRTDGTTDGTVRLTDINEAGDTFPRPDYPYSDPYLVHNDDTVFFVYEGGEFQQIWESPIDLNTRFDCTAVTQIPTSECEALVTLYNSMDGANWNVEEGEGWLETTTPCDWDGVTCNNGSVIQLSLGGMGLSGAIPPEIDDFQNLTHLQINDNRITSLPAEIGNLSNLDIFYISNNPLTGWPSSVSNLLLLNFVLDNVCEPSDPALQTWLDAMPTGDFYLFADPLYESRTGVLCSEAAVAGKIWIEQDEIPAAELGIPSPTFNAFFDEQLADITVNLVDSATGATFTTTTGSDGRYTFRNVPYGDYEVTVDTSSLPADRNATHYAPHGPTLVTVSADNLNTLGRDFVYSADEGDTPLAVDGTETGAEGAQGVLFLPFVVMAGATTAAVRHASAQ